MSSRNRGVAGGRVGAGGRYQPFAYLTRLYNVGIAILLLAGRNTTEMIAICQKRLGKEIGNRFEIANVDRIAYRVSINPPSISGNAHGPGDQHRDKRPKFARIYIAVLFRMACVSDAFKSECVVKITHIRPISRYNPPGSPGTDKKPVAP